MENLRRRQQKALSITVEINIVAMKNQQRVAFVFLTNTYPAIGVKYWTRCHEHATKRSFEYCCLRKIYTFLAILTASYLKTGREQFCGELMTPATIKPTQHFT